MNKEKDILHYENLKTYLRLGMKVGKIHRVFWLKNCIDFNAVKRTAAKSPFEKDFFKLMNNSVLGKTMENLYNVVV